MRPGIRLKNFKPCDICGVGTGISKQLIANGIGVRHWHTVIHKEKELYDLNKKKVCKSCLNKYGGEDGSVQRASTR